MTLRAAPVLSALALVAPLAAALPAEASPCRGLSPEECAFVHPRAERRMQLAFADEVFAPSPAAPAGWRALAPGVRPFTRFDIEGLRLMTRMP
ncbi:hypothetical protein M446_0914 [Methylobacterium sp. 4-46]|uniref:hypothetical protein n=1 Tax=unclassified Methylobacterium TaxID=2615210 RepID=UPI000152E157|nr:MULTISPECIES: hypothetical protein [Methylobacterium]ACA15463.1 hypothetical protein M446_0914 [Methylobacterium sp. 4-46]WFT81181.1 hypothetical protein QA634_04560 [Methylobacterium nodulans]